MNRPLATGLASLLLARVPRRAGVGKVLSLTTLVLAILAVAFVFGRDASRVAAAPPANDNFANRTVVTALPFTDSLNTAEATMEVDEPPSCVHQSSVWYEFTATSNAVLLVDTFGSGGDSRLAVYEVNPFPNAPFLTCLGGAPGEVFFDVTAGTTYYFQATAFGDPAGLVLNFREIPPPANDNLGTATDASTLPFSDGHFHTGAATTETGEPNPSCEFGPSELGQSVWYKITPPANTNLVANTFSDFGPTIALYSGPATSPTFAGLTFIRCTVLNTFRFSAIGGTTYYFQVGGLTGGNLEFHLAEFIQEGPPGDLTCTDGGDNDSDGFTDAADSGCQTTEGDLFSDSCSDGIDNDSDGLVDGADPACRVFEGPPGDLTCTDFIDNDGDGLVDSADSACQTTEGPPLSDSCFDSVDNDSDGLTDLDDPDCDSPPATNDNLAQVTTIAALPFTDGPVNTDAATIEAGEPNPDCGFEVDIGKTIWYKFTPSANARLASRPLSDFLTVMAFYTGPSSNPTFAELSLVGCNQDFDAIGGTTYYFQVGGRSFGESGNLLFRLHDVVPEGPPGDPKCTDGLDNDIDGFLDVADSGCQTTEGPPFSDSCFDGFDNDGDGLIDGADPDCQAPSPTPTPTATATATASPSPTATPTPSPTPTPCLECTPTPTPSASPTPVPPPPNDNFASRTVISAVPFADALDTSGATTETGEQSQCGMTKTVWYEFTPSSDMVISGSTFGSGFISQMSRYDHDPFLPPTPGCISGFGGLPVTGGTTVYFQVGGTNGSFGNLGFHLFPPGQTPSPPATATASPTATATPTLCPGCTPGPTATATRTASPTGTVTPFTPTPTRAATATPTRTPIPCVEFTCTPTPTRTATATPTATPMGTVTVHPTPTRTATATPTATPMGTVTSTPTPTATATATPTLTPSPTPGIVRTVIFRNDLTQTATDLGFSFFHSPPEAVGITVVQNAPGCPEPFIGDHIHIFLHEVDVVWSTPCVDPAESVTLGFSRFVSIECASWTLNGRQMGPATVDGVQPGNCQFIPTPTPTPTPTGDDGRAKKISAAGSVVLSDGSPDVKNVVVQVHNDGVDTETFGVYVDIVPPGGPTNPFGCTPVGRIIDTVVTLAPDEQTVISSEQTFNCTDVPGALNKTYTIKMAVDVHADDVGACGVSQINSVVCFNALADDDDDDSDNRVTATGPQVK
jgi:hypothetical protein